MAIGMDTKPLDDLLAYWRTMPIAEGAKVPAKSALSPSSLKPHLPNIGIFERLGRYDVQIRLFGTQLDEKFGKPMTGVNLFDFLPENQWEFYADLYEVTLDAPAGCRLVRKSVDKNDNVITGESLILPLADEAGEVRYTVGILLMESESPLDYPLDASKLHQAKIISVEFVDIGHGLPANPPALPG